MAVLVILYLVAVALMHFYQQKTIRKGREHAYNVLQNAARTHVLALNVTLAGKYESLESLAAILAEEKDADFSKIIKLMDDFKNISKVSFVGVADTHGNAYLHNGLKSKINDREYFKKSIKGERAIEKIQKTKHSGIPVILISVPIKLGEEIKGVLFANYTEDHFRSLLSPYCFNKECHSFICDDFGNIIVTSAAHDSLTGDENIRGMLERGDLDKEFDAEQILSNIRNAISGVFSLTINGQHSYVAYHPIHLNNWVFFSVEPTASIYGELAVISQSGQISMLIVLLSAIVIFLFIIVMDYRERKALEAEKELLRISEEEYRIFVEQSEKLLYRYDIKTKTIHSHPAMAEVLGVPMVFKYDSESVAKSGIILKESLEEHARFYEAMSNGEPTGSTVLNIRKTSGENAWYRGVFTMIYNDDGSPKHAIISMEDVTAQREKELAYELWRKKIKSDGLTKNVIYYDCNLTKDVCERKEGSLGFGVIDDIGSAFTDVIEYATKNIVYENDSDDFKDFFQKDRLLAQYYRGVSEESFECRVKSQDKDFRWIKGKAELAKDVFSTDIRAFLTFKDIDEKKRNKLELEAQAKNDPLTGVLNRVEFVRQMESLIQINASNLHATHALIMIDIDDFKQINDLYGHDSGDKLLVEMVLNLRKLMRKGDLLGRIGGDEFIIFLENITSEEVVRKRAELICQMIYRQLTPKSIISGSLGIAMYPRDGTSFSELYKKSDIALYKTKNENPGTYLLYDSSMEQELHEDPTSVPAKKLSANIKKDESKIEELVRLSDELLNEENAVAYIEWDLNAGKYYRSAEFEEYEMSTLTNEEFFDLFTKIPGIHPEDEPKFRVFYGRDIKTSQTHNEETLRIRKKDGKYVLSRIISTRLFDADNKIQKQKVSIKEIKE